MITFYCLSEFAGRTLAKYPFGTHFLELKKYSRGCQFFTFDSRGGEAPG